MFDLGARTFADQALVALATTTYLDLNASRAQRPPHRAEPDSYLVRWPPLQSSISSRCSLAGPEAKVMLLSICCRHEQLMKRNARTPQLGSARLDWIGLESVGGKVVKMLPPASIIFASRLPRKHT